MNGSVVGTEFIPAGIKRFLKNVYWHLFGIFFNNPPVPAAPRSFLFICQGNICRSPFTEAAARRCFADVQGTTFRSAGLIVNTARESPPNAIAAAKTFGIDLSSHRSIKINEDMVAAADMVFGMEAWHFRNLRKRFPQYKEKMFLLAPFENTATVRRNQFNIYNIQDPYGRDLKDFENCFERIEECLRGLFSVIQDSQVCG